MPDIVLANILEDFGNVSNDRGSYEGECEGIFITISGFHIRYLAGDSSKSNQWKTDLKIVQYNERDHQCTIRTNIITVMGVRPIVL